MVPPPPRSTLFPYTTLFRSVCKRSPPSVTATGIHKLFTATSSRSEEHTSELQSQSNLVCRLLLEKKKKADHHYHPICHKSHRTTLSLSPRKPHTSERLSLNH